MISSIDLSIDQPPISTRARLTRIRHGFPGWTSRRGSWQCWNYTYIHTSIHGVHDSSSWT